MDAIVSDSTAPIKIKFEVSEMDKSFEGMFQVLKGIITKIITNNESDVKTLERNTFSNTLDKFSHTKVCQRITSLEDNTESLEIFHHLDSLSEVLDAFITKLRAFSEMDVESTEILHLGHILGNSGDDFFISLFINIKSTGSFLGTNSKCSLHLLSLNSPSDGQRALVVGTMLIGKSDVFSENLSVDVERFDFGEESILSFQDGFGFGKFGFH